MAHPSEPCSHLRLDSILRSVECAGIRSTSWRSFMKRKDRKLYMLCKRLLSAHVHRTHLELHMTAFSVRGREISRCSNEPWLASNKQAELTVGQA